MYHGSKSEWSYVEYCFVFISVVYSLSLYFIFQLYNIVVDNEIVGKKLVQNGQLKRRYTIIPLDKIIRSKIPADAVKKAESLVCITGGDVVADGRREMGCLH